MTGARARLRDLAAYATGLARLQRGPLYLIHFVTLRCNAKCEHCFVPINTGKEEMSLEEIRAFTSKAPPLLYLALTGGEPLLRKDFVDVVAAYAEGPRPRIVNVITNGWQPDRADAISREICRAFPDLVFSMGVSLDGLGEAHDHVRRVPGLYEKALETAHRLHALERSQDNFRTEVVYTITPGNQDHAVETLAELARAAGHSNVFFNVQRESHGPDGAPGIDPERYAAALRYATPRREAQGLMNDGAMALFFQRVTLARNHSILRTLREQRHLGGCLAGSHSGVVWDDGTVFACELRDRPLGRLREADFDLARIWRDREAREERAAIAEERCFCTHECFSTVNVVFNPHRLIEPTLEGLRGPPSRAPRAAAPRKRRLPIVDAPPEPQG